MIKLPQETAQEVLWLGHFVLEYWEFDSNINKYRWLSQLSKLHSFVSFLVINAWDLLNGFNSFLFPYLHAFTIMIYCAYLGKIKSDSWIFRIIHLKKNCNMQIANTCLTLFEIGKHSQCKDQTNFLVHSFGWKLTLIHGWWGKYLAVTERFHVPTRLQAE